MAMSSVLVKSFQISTLASALALAGCGSGGNDTLPPKTSSSTINNSSTITNSSTSTDANVKEKLASVKKVMLVSDSETFYMNNGETITLTAYALDKNQIGVSGVPVEVKISDPNDTGIFSSTPQALTTDESGKATITLDVKSLTDTQKTFLRTTGLEITTQVGSAPSATKTLIGSNSKPNMDTVTNSIKAESVVLVSNSGTITMATGNKVSLTALVLDKDNNAILGKEVTFKFKGNNTSVTTGLFPSGPMSVSTNEKGEALLELELKSLTNTQKDNLLAGIQLEATTDGKTAEPITIKGTDPETSSIASNKFDVKQVKLTTPTPTFNINIGEKITVVASILNDKNTGMGGVPVVFEVEDPATTGVYAISKTSNVITNENGEATIELEVKSEDFKTKLQQGLTIKATAQNTAGSSAQDIIGQVKIVGKVAETTNTNTDNSALVSNVLLSSPTKEFDLAIGTKITVTASVADDKGGRLANVPVTFTLPPLANTGIANLSGSTVETNANGQATIELEVKSLNDTQRQNLSSGLMINATVANSNAQITPLKLTPKTTAEEETISSITVTSDNDSIYMSKGSKLKVTAIALDKNFGGLAGKTLNFSLPSPTTTGVFNISGSSLKTNAQGEATIELEIKSNLTESQKTALKNGLKITVTEPTSKISEAITIKGEEVSQAIVNAVTLTSNVTTFPLTIGSQFTVTASVTDSNNGGIKDVPVTFNVPSLETYGISNLSGSTVTTDAQGKATITLQIDSLTETQKEKLLAGVTINATANGKTAPSFSIKAKPDITVANVDQMMLITNINTFEAVIGQKMTVTARLLDKNNKPLANLPVNFSIPTFATTGINAKSPLSNVITNANGEATLELQVDSLTNNQKYYLLTQGIDVQATSGDKSANVTLQTREVAAANSVSSIFIRQNQEINMAVNEEITLTAYALDNNNGAVANAPVSFALPSGSPLVNETGAVVTTDENGKAVVKLKLASLTPAEKTALTTDGIEVTVRSGTVANTTIIKGAPSRNETTDYSIFVTKSKETLRTGNDTMSLTIRVTDSSGGIKANTPVSFNLQDARKYGLSLNKTSSLVTDSNGMVEIDVIQTDIGNVSKFDHETKLLVTVNDGNSVPKQEEIPIKVSGTAIGNVSATKTTLGNNDTTVVSGSLVDGTGRAISNMPIELLSNGQSLATPIIVTTDEKGQFYFRDLNSTKLGSAADGQFVLSAKVANPSPEKEPFVFSLITLKHIAEITELPTINLADANGQLIDGTDIEVNTTQKIKISVPPSKLTKGNTVLVSTTKGGLNGDSISVPVTLDSSGNGTVDIKSIVAGATKITVSYGYDDILLQDSLNFISMDVKKLILQFENTTVPANGETKVVATVKDLFDSPVRNALVEFSITKDSSGSSGLSTTYAKTDENGVATVTYYAGGSETANGGVTITANVNKVMLNNDIRNVATPQTITKDLTVQSNASYISFGQSDKVISSSDDVYYIRNSSVFVNNNIGQPAINQEVSIEFIPTTYLLGMYGIHPAQTIGGISIPRQWFKGYYATATTIALTEPSPVCGNEDDNLNAILDKPDNVRIDEDRNNNGKLDPIGYVTILSKNGTEVIKNQTMFTDNTGKLDFSIRYTKQVSTWMTGKLKVTTRVNGTEFVNYQEIDLPDVVDDIDIERNIRPNPVSPFGKYFKGYWGSDNDLSRDGFRYCR